MCKSALGKIADPLKLLTNPKTSGIADPLGLTKSKVGDPLGIFASEHAKQAAKDKAIAGDKERPLIYLSNPWLDSLGIAGVNARGRNSLRIDQMAPSRTTGGNSAATPAGPIQTKPLQISTSPIPTKPLLVSTPGSTSGGRKAPWRSALGINR